MRDLFSEDEIKQKATVGPQEILKDKGRTRTEFEDTHDTIWMICHTIGLKMTN